MALNVTVIYLNQTGNSLVQTGNSQNITGSRSGPAVAFFIWPYGFLTHDPLVTLKRILDNTLKFIINIFGIFTNIINIIIFSKIGFTDSVTVAFFGLAISDMGFLFFSTVMQLFSCMDTIIGYKPYLSLSTMTYIIMWYGNVFYDISIVVTVFTAVQKCACVVIPLLFKNIFTTSRSGIFIVIIYLIIFGYYLPTFTGQGLRPSFDRSLNRTRLRFSGKPRVYRLFDIYRIFNRIILPFVAQVIVLVCMVVLAVKLKQASRMRQKMTNERKAEPEDGAGGKDDSKTKTSAKELRVIKAVNVVSAIFVIANLPDIPVNFASLYFPEFNDYAKYEYLYQFLGALQDYISGVGAAINIFVYVKFNTKYRNKFEEIFGGIFSCAKSQKKV